MKIREFIDEPVDLRRLVKELPFEEDDFVNASLRQPKLFLEAGRLRVQKAEVLNRRKRKLDIIKSELGMMLRQAKVEKGRKPATEKSIEEQIITHRNYKKMRQLLDAAHAEDRAAEMLFDAYRQRRDMLKVIADVRNTEVSQELRAVRERMASIDSERLGRAARKSADEIS